VARFRLFNKSKDAGMVLVSIPESVCQVPYRGFMAPRETFKKPLKGLSKAFQQPCEAFKKPLKNFVRPLNRAF
jgi:hypothetical protein